MIYAINSNGIRVSASPEQEAICPVCNQKLIPKCGDIKIWHFAHAISEECDSFSEHESEWHINWKNRFDKSQREYIIEKAGERHIADIFVDGLIVELQHSPISPIEISIRERFYENMIWIFDLNDKYKEGHLSYKIKPFLYLNDPCQNKVWWHIKWMSQIYREITKPLFFDFGKGLIRVKEIDDFGGGTGYFYGYPFIQGNIKYYANKKRSIK